MEENPWTSCDKTTVSPPGKTNLGNLEKVVQLAYLTGHITKDEVSALDEIPAHTRDPLSQLIDEMKQFTTTQDAVLAATFRATMLELETSICRFTHATYLERKLSVLRKLSSHLTAMQCSIEDLVSRYSGDIFEGNYIMVHRQYQEDLINLAAMANTSVSSVTHMCTQIDVTMKVFADIASSGIRNE
eukprot:m.329304 g.329304  ORF g.329304 m.329304 type:complete len:187 (-) comp20445_c0_seq4:475-1035(-)